MYISYETYLFSNFYSWQKKIVCIHFNFPIEITETKLDKSREVYQFEIIRVTDDIVSYQ